MGTLARRDFLALATGFGILAVTAPLLTRGGLPEPPAAAGLPLLAADAAAPPPWQGMTAVILPALLVAGREYWVLLDDLLPLAPGVGVAQKFVAGSASLMTGVTWQNLGPVVPLLINVRVFADMSTP